MWHHWSNNERPVWLIRHEGEGEKVKRKSGSSVILQIMQIIHADSSIKWKRRHVTAMTSCTDTANYDSLVVVRVVLLLSHNVVQQWNWQIDRHHKDFMNSVTDLVWKQSMFLECRLPCVFSIKMTLESELKFCPVRIICWPPRTEQLSMSCFSTMGSSWAERWAAGTHKRVACNIYCLSTGVTFSSVWIFCFSLFLWTSLLSMLLLGRYAAGIGSFPQLWHITDYITNF